MEKFKVGDRVYHINRHEWVEIVQTDSVLVKGYPLTIRTSSGMLGPASDENLLPAIWHEDVPDDARNVRVKFDDGTTAWGWFSSSLDVWSTSNEAYSDRLRTTYGHSWNDATETVVAWAEIDDWLESIDGRSVEKKTKEEPTTINRNPFLFGFGLDMSGFDTDIQKAVRDMAHFSPKMSIGFKVKKPSEGHAAVTSPTDDHAPIKSLVEQSIFGKKELDFVQWNNEFVRAEFIIDEPNVFVTLTGDDFPPRVGYSQCNTSDDTFDRYEGMKRAMRRACKIGSSQSFSGDYQDFRRWVHEQKESTVKAQDEKHNSALTGWIECSDRMPDNTGTVEIKFGNGKDAVFWFGYYDAKNITRTNSQWNVTDFSINHIVTVDDCGKTHPLCTSVGKWRPLTRTTKIEHGEIVK